MVSQLPVSIYTAGSAPMAWAPGEAQVLAALIAVLVYVIYDDLRNYRVRNDVIVLLLAMFGIVCVLKGSLAFALSHLAFGGVLFAILLVMYRFGMMGGGDVKLLAVAYLWLGQEPALFFSVMLSVFGLLYSLAARLKLAPGKRVHGRMKVPFAPSIALAWALTLLVQEIGWPIPLW